MKAWIEEDNINYEYIIRYLRDTIPQREGQLLEMERYAKENDVPISQPESIRLIEVLLKLMNAKNILEIGSAIGYSAIRMSRATDARVVTVELSEEMVSIAEKNIKEAGLSDKIQIIQGDGCKVLREMQGEGLFDVIFVDAAKGQYMELFEDCVRLLRKGGLLISDNILYKGMTATDELVVRRKITIVRRLRAYLEMLKNNKDFSTSIVPIGDGVALSFKE
ncbi:MAG: O-methyltransferase [Clostridia bacterium]|nr:O-methyltransferase [Clostridia bacterium]MBQ9737742.1 O-methyltransferase [Clostridia bacterium]